MADSGGIKVGAIQAIANSRDARLQIYFHKTKKELEEFLAIVQEYRKRVKKYNNMRKADLAPPNSKNAATLIESIQDCPEVFEVHLGVIHQYLGEEFALVAEYFPDDLVDEVKRINEIVQELISLLNLLKSSVSELHQYVTQGLVDGNIRSEKFFDKLPQLLEKYEDRVTALVEEVQIEERLEKEEKLVALQTTANNILRTWKDLFREMVSSHIQEFMDARKIKEIHFSVYFEIQEKKSSLPKGKEEIVVNILVNFVKNGAYERKFHITIGFSPEKDCFWAESSFPGSKGFDFYNSISELVERTIVLKEII